MDSWRMAPEYVIYSQQYNNDSVYFAFQFIRCKRDDNATFEMLCQLISEDVGEEPRMIISCFGGAEYFTMTDSLEQEFMNGISQAASTKRMSQLEAREKTSMFVDYIGVWILTTGLNSGVSKLIGQAAYRKKLLDEKSPKPTVIGLTSWNTVTENTREVLKQRRTLVATKLLPLVLSFTFL